MTKVTKKDNFKAIIEVLQANGKDELVEVMAHEVELLEKKASNTKATKNQVANGEIKDIILEELARIGNPVTITELINQSEVVAERTGKSNQKVSALMTQLKNAGLVIRTLDKKTARFRVATDTEVAE